MGKDGGSNKSRAIHGKTRYPPRVNHSSMPSPPPVVSRILGIGVDLVENSRIADSLSRFGDHFLNRVFREEELCYCQKMRDPVPHYAARFAAKEAVAKAFGCGIGEHLAFRDVEVLRNASGAPGILLHGGAGELAANWGVVHIFLTLSHTQEHATANVLLAQ